MSVNVLLTGATGAVGAALLPELLDQGFTVYCLIRPKDGQSVRDRLASISTNPRAVAISGDVTFPLCGVDVKDLDEALTMAKSWPGGNLVEVRPLIDHSAEPAR